MSATAHAAWAAAHLSDGEALVELPDGTLVYTNGDLESPEHLYDSDTDTAYAASEALGRSVSVRTTDGAEICRVDASLGNEHYWRTRGLR